MSGCFFETQAHKSLVDKASAGLKTLQLSYKYQRTTDLYVSPINSLQHRRGI